MASDENNNKVNVKALDERTLEWAKFKARTKRHWEKRSPIAFQTSLVILNDTWKMALVGAITGSIFPFGELYARPWETPGFGKYLVESSMRSKSALNCAIAAGNLAIIARGTVEMALMYNPERSRMKYAAIGGVLGGFYFGLYQRRSLVGVGLMGVLMGVSSTMWEYMKQYEAQHSPGRHVV